MSFAAEPEIDIAVQSPDWRRIAMVEKLAQAAAEATLRLAPFPPEIAGREVEASYVLANDELLQVMNRTYREIDKPTNVLSFAALDARSPQGDGSVFHLGDVMISFETLEREAQDLLIEPAEHLQHLVVHGTLHLLGYDHIDDDDANIMETLEIKILAALGVRNPYVQIDDA